MKNKLVLALAAVVLMAAPAFAAVQNVKVSGDIDSSYVNRQHFGLGTKATVAGIPVENSGVVNQSVFLTQTRLRVDADLSDNVSTTVRLLNERVWGGNDASDPGRQVNTTQSQIDIDLAYVTLREFLYSPLTVTVGRQEFIYGNGLILGGNGPNNGSDGGLKYVAGDLTKQASNDGVKLVLDYKPLTLDLVYIKASTNESSITLGSTGSIYSSKNDTDVYGINANYQLGDAMNTVVEGYVFSKFDRSTFNSGTKNNVTYVPGLRVSTNPVKGLNTQAEVAWQGGRNNVSNGPTAGQLSVKRNAMAAQFMATYALPVAELEKYKTSVNAAYTYVSGDKNTSNSSGAAGGNKSYGAWDSMYEGQNGGTVFNAIIPLTNLHILNVGASASPIQDVTTSLNWYHLIFAERAQYTNSFVLSQPDGSTVTPAATTTRNKTVGDELDVNVNYAYTEDVTLGLNLGWFVPGGAFGNVNDTVASQAIAHVNVNF